MPTRPYLQYELEFNEHHPITGSKFATFGNGRYVFILGNKKTYIDDAIHYSQFELECIDLYLSEKVRYIINGLQDIGFVLAFYALSSTAIVIVDYSEQNAIVKQTAVILDENSFTGAYFFERTYCVSTTIAFFFVHCVVGQLECAVFAPPNNSRNLNRPDAMFCCHLIPKLPWSKNSDRNRSTFVQNVNAQLVIQHGTSISRWESPQFITEAELAFFLDRGQGICPDPFAIVVINMNTGIWRMVACEADMTTGFPRDVYDQMPIDSTALHCASGQIALLTTYGRPINSYHAHFARLLQQWSRYVWRAFYFSAEYCSWAAPFFLHIALAMTTLRSRLLYNPAAKIGVLNTNNWRWIEVYCVNDYYFTNVLMFDDGQTLIHETDKNWNFEHYGIVRNPFVVSSLWTSAELMSRPYIYNVKREAIMKWLK